jgi:hypothetical protein
MGYVEETGAAQHYRDARIAPIYEGTNGIQAIDLVTRKLPLNGGATVKACLDELRATIVSVSAHNDTAFGTIATRLAEAVDSVDRTSAWMLDRLETKPEQALAGATPYLRLFANAAGGVLIAGEALAAARLDTNAASRIALARFFAEHIVVAAAGLERAVIEGADSINGADAALAERI